MKLVNFFCLVQILRSLNSGIPLPTNKMSGVCAVQTRYEGACDSAFISLVAPVPLHFIVNLSWEKIYVITPYTLLSLAYWRYFSFIFFIHVFSHMLLVLLIYSLFKSLHLVKEMQYFNFTVSEIPKLLTNECTFSDVPVTHLIDQLTGVERKASQIPGTCGQK